MIDAAVLTWCILTSTPTTRGAHTAACMAGADFDAGRIPQQSVDAISRAAQIDWTRTSAYEWEVIGREEQRLLMRIEYR